MPATKRKLTGRFAPFVDAKLLIFASAWCAQRLSASSLDQEAQFEDLRVEFFAQSTISLFEW
jgi:hypothetical protein